MRSQREPALVGRALAAGAGRAPCSDASRGCGGSRRRSTGPSSVVGAAARRATRARRLDRGRGCGGRRAAAAGGPGGPRGGEVAAPSSTPVRAGASARHDDDRSDAGCQRRVVPHACVVQPAQVRRDRARPVRATPSWTCTTTCGRTEAARSSTASRSYGPTSASPPRTCPRRCTPSHCRARSPRWASGMQGSGPLAAATAHTFGELVDAAQAAHVAGPRAAHALRAAEAASSVRSCGAAATGQTCGCVFRSIVHAEGQRPAAAGRVARGARGRPGPGQRLVSTLTVFPLEPEIVTVVPRGGLLGG